MVEFASGYWVFSGTISIKAAIQSLLPVARDASNWLDPFEISPPVLYIDAVVTQTGSLSIVFRTGLARKALSFASLANIDLANMSSTNLSISPLNFLSTTLV